MAHFAQLDENNNVIKSVVVNNDDIQNLPFPESEPVCVVHLKELFGSETIWKQYSYNKNFRINCAIVGGKFYPNYAEHGGFSPPKPYDDWTFNEEVFCWVAPVPRPKGELHLWEWDPENHNWVAITPVEPETETTIDLEALKALGQRPNDPNDTPLTIVLDPPHIALEKDPTLLDKIFDTPTQPY